MNANNLLAAARCPGVPPLLLVQAGAGLAGGIFQSTFSLVLQQQYKLTSKESGMVLSYVGGCIVFGEFRTQETSAAAGNRQRRQHSHGSNQDYPNRADG